MRVETWKDSMVIPSSSRVSSTGFCGSGVNVVEHLAIKIWKNEMQLIAVRKQNVG